MTTPRVRDAHCAWCGTAFVPPLSYPRTCPNADCGVTIWANPIPVVIALVPVQHHGRLGLLVIRRGIDPRLGLLGLVGGFLEDHERWQAGGAREVYEETGVRIDPNALDPFWFASTEPRPNRVLLFGVAAPLVSSALEAFAVTHESTERGLVFGPDGLDDVFAFSLHAEAARRFFAARGITGPHGYTQV